MKYLKKTAYLLTALICVGCATHQNSKTYSNIEEVNSITAIGRSAVKSPEFNGQVFLNLKEPRKNYVDLILQGSLGAGRTELSLKPNTIIIKSDNREYRGDDVDQLFAEITDIPWPISGSLSWIKGLTNKSETIITYDEQNRPLHFIEDGWTVRYQDWHTQNGLSLPEKLTIEQGDIRLRVVIERWRLS